MNIFPRYPASMRPKFAGSNTQRTADAQAHYRCASCDYDLYSLPTDGECPECGYTIRESIAEAKRKASSSGLRAAFAGMMWIMIVMLVGINLFLIIVPDFVLALLFFLLLIVSGVIAGLAVFIGAITGMWKTPEFAPAAVLFAISCLMFAGNAMWLEIPMP